MTINKKTFLLKAAMVGLLGMAISQYSFSDLGNVSINVPIWITILIFTDHFRLVLLLWLAFQDYIPDKMWVVAGSVGSVLYTLSLVIFRTLISPDSEQFIILGRLFIGAISAVPVWLFLKNYYSKAYLWLLANAIGYMLMGIFLKFAFGIGWLYKAIGYSFLTLQVIPATIWYMAYALFGLILGESLYRIIESRRILDT